MSDYDKRQWQAEQAARDAESQKQREKFAKARERSARNAKRKLERLKRKLTDEGEISEFEGEFSESVLERLDAFGAAFADPQLGRPGDALSAAQKRVVAGMNRKAKALRKKAKAERLAAQGSGKTGEAAPEEDVIDELTRPGRDRRYAPDDRKDDKPRYSSFRSKRKSKFTPRVRQLDDDFEDEAAPSSSRKPKPDPEPERPPVGKPFLRIARAPEPAPEPKPEPPQPGRPTRKPFLRIIDNDD